MLMKTVFWGSVFLIIYPYLGYPLIVAILSAIRPRPVLRKAWEPTVTVLIPAFNEADCIAQTVANKLEQNYPKNKQQIIVVSDGSTDGTDDIVRTFAHHGVQLLRCEKREGKSSALNEAMRSATGEIVIFSDANSVFHSDAIRYMVENFSDPSVGYVTGTLQYIADNGSLSGSGSDAYMKFENILRRAETRIGSIIGVNGGVDAIRRDLYTDIQRELITDFVLPLRVIASGYRVVSDPRAVSRESANSALNSEFRMRVRVALRALQGLVHMKRLFNPVNYPLTSFCLFSHKLIRYLSFVFMIFALIANARLALLGPFYQYLLIFQLSLYGLALLGITGSLPAIFRRLTVVPSYFLMSNAAFAVAVVRFLRGETMATWRPREG